MVYGFMQRSGVRGPHQPSSSSLYLFFVTGSLCEPIAHLLSCISWLVSSRDLHVSILQHWDQYRHTRSPSQLHLRWGLGRESSHLGGRHSLTEKPPQSQRLCRTRIFLFTNRILRVGLCCFDISKHDVKLHLLTHVFII